MLSFKIILTVINYASALIAAKELYLRFLWVVSSFVCNLRKNIKSRDNDRRKIASSCSRTYYFIVPTADAWMGFI